LRVSVDAVGVMRGNVSFWSVCLHVGYRGKTGNNLRRSRPPVLTYSGHHAPLDASFPLDDDYTLVAELELRPHGHRRLAAEWRPLSFQTVRGISANGPSRLSGRLIEITAIEG
jgi:hypothetical protein